jgi:hypothetical protein
MTSICRIEEKAFNNVSQYVNGDDQCLALPSTLSYIGKKALAFKNPVPYIWANRNINAVDI